MSTISGTSASTWTPLASTNNQDPGLANTAAAMSIDAAVVGSLGGSTVISLSASSLLDRLVSASEKSQQLLAPSTPTTASTSPTTADGTSQGATPTSDSAGASDSGDANPVYNASGALQGLGNADANWAKVLQSNPELAADAAQALIGQGIVNTLA